MKDRRQNFKKRVLGIKISEDNLERYTRLKTRDPSTLLARLFNQVLLLGIKISEDDLERYTRLKKHMTPALYWQGCLIK